MVVDTKAVGSDIDQDTVSVFGVEGAVSSRGR